VRTLEKPLSGLKYRSAGSIPYTVDNNVENLRLCSRKYNYWKLILIILFKWIVKKYFMPIKQMFLRI